ncbi:hypothetical protein KY290_013644 [Solanum tuberosum]|uniref:Uncharacterized protein n=1 Tax=Solanum tuberosum TaxID=4113 RepID=A0ABQ7VP49_SOLTU|nr:hypothetical protein KY289_013773 [Solanum tuberosum]KAH0769663.1 hypothetical protein KY290_013644 [Solanum tuberosum]
MQLLGSYYGISIRKRTNYGWNGYIVTMNKEEFGASKQIKLHGWYKEFLKLINIFKLLATMSIV